MNAEQVKAALRSRHHASPAPMPGEWTTVSELWGIDLLAWSAWSSGKFRRVGYEVKVSRSDYRGELLKPSKRARATSLCHQFYFAVPAGLLRAEEIAYVEPIWDDGAFERVKCPARCVKVRRHARRGDRYAPGRGTVAKKRVPVPIVVDGSDRMLRYYNSVREDREWMTRTAEREGLSLDAWLARERDRQFGYYLDAHGWTHRACPECGGKGYVKGSRVEEEAPQLWVPTECGLVEVHARGTREVKKAPLFDPDPLDEPLMAEAFRWASLRSDPRHRVS